MRSRRHQRAKREILDAAWRLAEERGIAGLSLREVARTVGLQAPSLYTYFDSKDDLFDEMFAEGYNQLAECVVSWRRQLEGQDRAEVLATMLTHWIRFCQGSISRYQLLFTRAIPGWEPSAETYAVARQTYQQMEEALHALGFAGAEDVDLYTAVASGLAAQQIANDPDGDRWVRLVPTAVRMLLDSVEQGRRA